MRNHRPHPRLPFAGFAVAAMLVVVACGDDSGGSSSGGSSPERDDDAVERLASADEVIQVVESNATGWFVDDGAGNTTDHVDYGFVIENVSDQVAVSVRVQVDFLDADGNPYEEVRATGADFSVVLPGQRLGAGGSERLDDGVAYEDLAELDVRVTLISALDTLDGQNHAASAYQELQVSEPVLDPDRGSSEQEWVAVQVTNTYDVPITPRESYVHRDADGTIVGGGRAPQAMDEIPPGGTGTGAAVRDLRAPRLENATTEVFVDPQLGWLVGLDAVWQDFDTAG